MIQVRVADVIGRELAEQIGREQFGEWRVSGSAVVLCDEASGHALCIWMSPHEAEQIGRALREVPAERPLTYGLAASLLQAAATVEEVRIEALKEDVFYATIRLTGDRGAHEVDARPSDAIGLALVVGCPIYVADEVMAGAGLPVPAGIRLQPHAVPSAAELPPPATPDERQRRRERYSQYQRRLVAYLFGREA